MVKQCWLGGFFLCVEVAARGFFCGSISSNFSVLFVFVLGVFVVWLGVFGCV